MICRCLGVEAIGELSTQLSMIWGEFSTRKRKGINHVTFIHIRVRFGRSKVQLFLVLLFLSSWFGYDAVTYLEAI